MVLRDAHLHKMVDGRDGGDLIPCPVPYHHSLYTLLQLPRRVRQKSGRLPDLEDGLYRIPNGRLTDGKLSCSTGVS